MRSVKRTSSESPLLRIDKLVRMKIWKHAKSGRNFEIRPIVLDIVDTAGNFAKNALDQPLYVLGAKSRPYRVLRIQPKTLPMNIVSLFL